MPRYLTVFAGELYLFSDFDFEKLLCLDPIAVCCSKRAIGAFVNHFPFLLLNILFLFDVYGYFLHTYVCALGTFLVHKEAKRGVISFRTGVTSKCVVVWIKMAPMGSWGVALLGDMALWE